MDGNSLPRPGTPLPQSKGRVPSSQHRVQPNSRPGSRLWVKERVAFSRSGALGDMKRSAGLPMISASGFCHHPSPSCYQALDHSAGPWAVPRAGAGPSRAEREVRPSLSAASARTRQDLPGKPCPRPHMAPLAATFSFELRLAGAILSLDNLF